ncbi:hypothetical protein ACHAWO_009875 [Cyclotella atomus]|uniref:Choline transporter-like protein n=1 Tax=Cyclotella atomus TaxID=382360 RepID=A0ABD3P027_9STRA
MASYYNYNETSPQVVVQGVAVKHPIHIYDHSHATHGVGAAEVHSQPINDNTGGNWTKGEHQPRRCNDAAFAILFYAHIGVMAWATAAFAPRMAREVAESHGYNQRDLLLEDDSGVTSRVLSWMIHNGSSYFKTVIGHRMLQEDDENDAYSFDATTIGTDDVGDMMMLLGISAGIALIISTLALTFMIRHAQFLIKFALLFNIATVTLFTTGSLFLSPFAAIMGIFLTGMTIWYAYVVWGRIPFAACNLVTATTAVRANLGLSIFAYSNLLLMFGWAAWWMVAFASTIYVTSGCNGQGVCESEGNGIVMFFLFLSFYWTSSVIKNTLHVTVAGVVGTWWFVPTEASSFCSSAVRDSYARSMTTSFGSICMGSLVVAIVETLENTVKNQREESDGLLLCLAQCILACLRDVIEYFNTWAYVFVGLYGYTFLEAGKGVIELFKTRGWTTIITDNLAQSVLSMLSAAVGLLTGLVAMTIAHGQGMVFGNELGASAAAFFIGFIVGTVLTSTLMTLVSSAVNTVIVCYAEAPAEFQTNHPKLSDNMRSTWRQAWPSEFNY